MPDHEDRISSPRDFALQALPGSKRLGPYGKLHAVGRRFHAVMYSGNPPPISSGGRPVTLITTFRLREDAPPDRFVRLWADAGNVMARRRGFISAGLYPASGGYDAREYIQVARWSNAALLASARADPELQRVQAQVNELVTFLRRVLCDAPVEEVMPAP